MLSFKSCAISYRKNDLSQSPMNHLLAAHRRLEETDALFSYSPDCLSSIPWSTIRYADHTLPIHWDQTTDQSSRRIVLQKRFFEWLSQFVGPLPGKRVLDLFSGPGVAASVLLDMGIAHYTGVDGNLRIVDWASEKYGGDSRVTILHRNVLTDVVFLAKKFDVILISYEVLNSLREHEESVLQRLINFASGEGTFLAGDIRLVDEQQISYRIGLSDYCHITDTTGICIDEFGLAGSGALQGHRYMLYARSGSLVQCGHHFVRLLTANDLKRFLRGLGFEPISNCQLLRDSASDVLESLNNLFFVGRRSVQANS